MLIVNYGTPDLTLTAAGSACDDPRVGEVIVVDNAAPGDPTSVPRLRDFAAQHADRVRFVAAGVNRGFGAGTNLAAAQATLPYLFLLNSDATLQPGALQPLIDALADTGVGVVAPPVYQPDGTLQPDAFGRFPTPWRILLRRTRARRNDPSPDWVSGVACLVRRAEFMQSGGFDEAIFMYHEDVELCWRYRRQLGRSIRRLQSGAGVVHQGGASHPVSRLQRQTYDRSQDYFLHEIGCSAASRRLVRLVRAVYRRAGGPRLTGPVSAPAGGADVPSGRGGAP